MTTSFASPTRCAPVWNACNPKTKSYMDSLISFVKHNVPLISLLIGLLGVVVAVLSLRQELRERKRRLQKNQSSEEDAGAGQGQS